MYLILNFLNQILNTILFALLASFLLTPKYSRIKSISVFTLFSCVIFIYKFRFYHELATTLISSVILQALLYMFIIITFNDSLLKKIFACVSILIPTLTSEYIALMLYNRLFDANNVFLPNSKEFFIVTIIALFTQIIIANIIILIWRAISHKKNFANMLYFTLLPYIMLYLFATIFAPFIFGSTALNSALLSICVIIVLISCIILFYYTLRHNEKKTIEEAYEELQKLYAMDSEYYRALENRHEELAKMRHDYQNQLATLYMLISTGKTEAAKEFADSLLKSLS